MTIDYWIYTFYTTRCETCNVRSILRYSLNIEHLFTMGWIGSGHKIIDNIYETLNIPILFSPFFICFFFINISSCFWVHSVRFSYRISVQDMRTRQLCPACYTCIFASLGCRYWTLTLYFKSRKQQRRPKRANIEHNEGGWNEKSRKQKRKKRYFPL